MPTPESRTPIAALMAALIADGTAIGGFAAAGRRSHAEGMTLAGIGETAWPFLAGALVGWVVCRGWRRPLAVVPTGATIWIATVGVGMVLRQLTGSGTAWSFVIVTTVVIGLLLLGWRLVAGHVGRRRRRSVP